jgi:hypothetical protein
MKFYFVSIQERDFIFELGAATTSGHRSVKMKKLSNLSTADDVKT